MSESETEWLLASELKASLEKASVSAVPVPAAAWLFASGLIGVVGMARRKSRS